MKLNVKAFALSGALLWSLGLLLFSLLAQRGSYGAEFVQLLSSVYPGYELSAGGIVVGCLWAFFDAGIGLWIFAWLYNRFAS